jgi:hypothetical protein
MSRNIYNYISGPCKKLLTDRVSMARSRAYTTLDVHKFHWDVSDVSSGDAYVRRSVTGALNAPSHFDKRLYPQALRLSLRILHATSCLQREGEIAQVVPEEGAVVVVVAEATERTLPAIRITLRAGQTQERAAATRITTATRTFRTARLFLPRGYALSAPLS